MRLKNQPLDLAACWPLVNLGRTVLTRMSKCDEEVETASIDHL